MDKVRVVIDQRDAAKDIWIDEHTAQSLYATGKLVEFEERYGDDDPVYGVNTKTPVLQDEGRFS